MPRVSMTEAIATMLSSSIAIMGMKTFHCQRIPVAHRTMGGRFMGVSHQRRGWFAREDVTLAEGAPPRRFIPDRQVRPTQKAAATRIVATGVVFLLQSGRMAEKLRRIDG